MRLNFAIFLTLMLILSVCESYDTNDAYNTGVTIEEELTRLKFHLGQRRTSDASLFGGFFESDRDNFRKRRNYTTGMFIYKYHMFSLQPNMSMEEFFTKIPPEDASTVMKGVNAEILRDLFEKSDFKQSKYVKYVVHEFQIKPINMLAPGDDWEASNNQKTIRLNFNNDTSTTFQGSGVDLIKKSSNGTIKQTLHFEIGPHSLPVNQKEWSTFKNGHFTEIDNNENIVLTNPTLEIEIKQSKGLLAYKLYEIKSEKSYQNFQRTSNENLEFLNLLTRLSGYIMKNPNIVLGGEETGLFTYEFHEMQLGPDTVIADLLKESSIKKALEVRIDLFNFSTTFLRHPKKILSSHKGGEFQMHEKAGFGQQAGRIFDPGLLKGSSNISSPEYQKWSDYVHKQAVTLSKYFHETGILDKNLKDVQKEMMQKILKEAHKYSPLKDGHTLHGLNSSNVKFRSSADRRVAARVEILENDKSEMKK